MSSRTTRGARAESTLRASFRDKTSHRIYACDSMSRVSENTSYREFRTSAPVWTCFDVQYGKGHVIYCMPIGWLSVPLPRIVQIRTRRRQRTTLCARRARRGSTRASRRIASRAYISRTSEPREQRRRRRRRRARRKNRTNRASVFGVISPPTRWCYADYTPGFGSRARFFGRETVDRCDRTLDDDADAADGSR